MLLLFGGSLLQALHHFAEIRILSLILVLFAVQLDHQTVIYFSRRGDFPPDFFFSFFLLS